MTTKPTFAQSIAKLETYTETELRKYFATKTSGPGKGVRGWAFEELLNVSKTSDLNDLSDGELKTVELGGHLNITSLAHTLDDAILFKPFEKTKLYKKMQKVIFCFFDKKTKEFKGIRVFDIRNHKSLKKALKEDYKALCEYIRCCYVKGRELSGRFKGPNGFLFLPTSGYGQVRYMGRTLSSKYYRAWSFRNQFLQRVYAEVYNPLSNA